MKPMKLFPMKKKVGETEIPGSKSYTNRALVIAAMAKGLIKIKNPLISNDTRAMISCLQKLGIKINQSKNLIEVIGSIHDVKKKNYQLDANLSGTTIRFLLPLLALTPGTKIIKGKEGLNKRPIKDLVEALQKLGAKIEYLEKIGFPPISVSQSKLKGKTIILNGGISSQYFSSILMSTPLIGRVKLKVKGDQISKPYIDMTLDIMKNFGVDIKNKNHTEYEVLKKQDYQAIEYCVEGDFSSAGYFLAIAALTKSTLTLKNLNKNSLQADKNLLDVLRQMGNKIICSENEITITGTGIKPVTVNMVDFPDQVQTLAVLCSFAKGVTRISGIKSLRIKETERVVALEKELKKMGIKTFSTYDTLTIYGGKPKPAKIKTYGDHRMAMSFAIAGAKLSGMEICDPEVVEKTFPEFWRKLESIGVKISGLSLSYQEDAGPVSSQPQNLPTALTSAGPHFGAPRLEPPALVNFKQNAKASRAFPLGSPKNIVLIGMRGSGKTTVAKLLSKKLNKDHLELDEILVNKTGKKIPEIVKKYGWDYFRDIESKIADEISTHMGKVISTGGGVVTRDKNIKALKKNGVLVLLKAPIDILLERIGEDKNRPSLTDKKSKKEEMEEILLKRRKIYENCADEIVDTENLDPEKVANEILLKLERKNI